MVEYAASGDARRTMELLWGQRSAGSRGPKQRFSVDSITAAAIDLADAEGLDKVTMRGVAERLGTSAMSLYTYVPGKAELLDLMVDTVLSGRPRGYDLAGGWRPAVEAWAADEWALYERHPWLLQVAANRGAMGPGELDSYEEIVRLMAATGMSAIHVARAAGSLSNYVSGAATAVARARDVERVTGQSDDEWWYERSALLEEVAQLDWAERFPSLTRLSGDGAYDQLDREEGDASGYIEREALDDFAFGLGRMLDGIDSIIG